MPTVKRTRQVPWHQDMTEVHRLAYWMHHVGLITDPVELLDLVERPYRYEDDYQAMLADQEDQQP